MRPEKRSADPFRLLAGFATATVCEAAGGEGIVDVDLRQVIPGSRAAGPARTVLCGQGDNLAVHEALASVRPGEVLVITMPEPAPFGAVGELIVLQAQARGAAGMVVDVAVRDIAELKEIGIPSGLGSCASGRRRRPTLAGSTYRSWLEARRSAPGTSSSWTTTASWSSRPRGSRRLRRRRGRAKRRNPVSGPGCGRGSSPTTCSGYVPRKERDAEDTERGNLAAGALG